MSLPAHSDDAPGTAAPAPVARPAEIVPLPRARGPAGARLAAAAGRAAGVALPPALTLLVLLALWLGRGFCTVFFARELSRITVFGWPLSFYMAAQGAALVCLAIIGGYAWRMRQLDRAYARALRENA